MQVFAKFISYLFHPIWMPLFVVLMFWEMNSRVHFYPESNVWFYIFLVVFINSIFIPLLMFWMMKSLNIISSLKMDKRQDRLFPFLITGVFYITTWFVFYNLGIMDLMAYLFIVAALLVFLAILVNLFWKISIHSIAMGAMSVFIIYLTALHFINSFWPAYGIVLLSGFVGFSRLMLKSHSPAQVYTGYLLGALVTVGFLMGFGLGTLN